MDDLRLTVRIDFGSGGALGPGKIRLLESIQKTGSISQAGRLLGMSYRRAWLLVDDLNRCFHAPVVRTQPGGARGGGAELTRLGRDLIKKYRLVEKQAAVAATKQLRGLQPALRRRDSGKQRRLKTSIQAPAR